MKSIKKILILPILILALVGCGTTTPCDNLEGECENWGLNGTDLIPSSIFDINFQESLVPVTLGDVSYSRSKEKNSPASEILENKGDMYISTGEGLIYYPANGDGDGKIYDIQDLSGSILAKDTILVLKEKSVYKLDPQGKLTIIPNNDIIDKVVKMTSSPDGTVYVALDDGKIMKSDDLGDTWELIDNFPSREVTDIDADDTKIYVGTKNKGLQVYNTNGLLMKSYKTTTSPLTSNHVISVEHKNGKVYVLTSNSFMVLDEATGIWETYTTADGLLTNSMTSFDVLDEDNIYLGSKKGISYTHDGGNTWNSYNTITDLNINDLYANNPTELLVTNDVGIHLVNLTDGKIFSGGSDRGLPKNIQINDMAIHNNGTIYLATQEHGIFISKDLDRWRSYSIDRPVKKITIDMKDSDDTTIFFLTDEGLRFLDDEDGVIHNIDTEDSYIVEHSLETDKLRFPDGWIDEVIDIQSKTTMFGRHFLFVLFENSIQTYNTMNGIKDWLHSNDDVDYGQYALNNLYIEPSNQGNTMMYDFIIGTENSGVIKTQGGVVSGTSDSSDIIHEDGFSTNYKTVTDIDRVKNNYYLATNNGIMMFPSNDFTTPGDLFIPNYNGNEIKTYLDIDVSIVKEEKIYLTILPEKVPGKANNKAYYLIDSDEDFTTTNNQEVKELSTNNGLVNGDLIQSEFDTFENLIILTTKGVTKYTFTK